MLKILFNLNLDADYKNNEFFETLLKKNFEFIPSKRNSNIIFNLSLILLLAEIDLISEEQSYKGDILGVYNTRHIKIVFVLSTKIVALHIGAIIVQIGVPDLKIPILKYVICFAIFVAFNKQF